MLISLLSVDVKIISKALSKRLKNVLLPLISDNQSAYVDGRFNSEGGSFNTVSHLEFMSYIKLRLR